MSGLVQDFYDFALPMRPASRYRILAYIAATIGLAGFFLISQELEPLMARNVILLSCLLVIGGISMGFSVPIIWLMGFVLLLILLQPSDPVFANAGPNRQFRETYYIAARPFWLNLVPFIPIVVGAIYHWLPRVSKYRYNEYLGALHAWATVIGLIAFFHPQILFGFVWRFIGFGEHLDPEVFFEWQWIEQKIKWCALALIAFGGLVFAYLIFDMLARKRRI